MGSRLDYIIKNGVLTRYIGDEKELVIPDGVTAIAPRAFLSRYTLIGITIPKGVTVIGEAAFLGCKGLKYINIPDTVTSIGKSAFYWCRDLRVMKLPKGLSCIEEATFSNCENITEIHVPDGVERIGDFAFSGCRELREITLPDSITDIGDNAFSECSQLDGISFPDNTKVGNSAFFKCRSMADDKGFVTVHGTLYGYVGKEKNVVIPEGVERIDRDAFEKYTEYNSITVPGSVSEIGPLTFGNMNKLSEVILSEGVSAICDNAFFACSGLKKLVLPKSLTRVDRLAFSGCEGIEELVLPDGYCRFSGSVLEDIWNSMFPTASSTAMMAAFLKYTPASVIEDPAIYRKLKANKKRIINKSIQRGDVHALSKILNCFKSIGLDELDEYIESAENELLCHVCLINYKNSRYSLIRRDRAANKKIEKELGLRELTAAELKKLYSYTVDGEGLVITSYKGEETEIVIPSRIGRRDVIGIGEYAFSPRQERVRPSRRITRANITSVTVPRGVERIGDSAFEGCGKLSTLILPDTVDSIGQCAFRGCNNLKNRLELREIEDEDE